MRAINGSCFGSILIPCLYSNQKINNVKSPDEKPSESQDFKIQSTTFQYAQQQKGLTRCLQNLFYHFVTITLALTHTD